MVQKSELDVTQSTFVGRRRCDPFFKSEHELRWETERMQQRQHFMAACHESERLADDATHCIALLSLLLFYNVYLCKYSYHRRLFRGGFVLTFVLACKTFQLKLLTASQSSRSSACVCDPNIFF